MLPSASHRVGGRGRLDGFPRRAHPRPGPYLEALGALLVLHGEGKAVAVRTARLIG